MVKKVPIAGSLILAKEMLQGDHKYQLWGIVVECKRKAVEVVVVEVVPEDFKAWENHCDPIPQGSRMDVSRDLLTKVVHPRRRLRADSPTPQFVLKLSNGRLVNVFSNSDDPGIMRLLDLAAFYGDKDKRKVFYRDVMVTRSGMERLDKEDS